MRAKLGLCLLIALGCHQSQLFDAHGVVEEVQRDTGQVVIRHDDIPGLMPGMTMNFDVPDPALLARLAPGQTIDFKLEFTGKAYRVIGARIERTDAPTTGATSITGGPLNLEPAPPFRLIDQDGNPLALADLRGKLVLLDFVYTRCPGPCPILTGVHADLQRALDPATRARIHFVSISLDPVRDTPAALREYAAKRGADLADWSFLTGSPEEVAQVLAAYGVGSLREPEGTIAHLVITFLIGPDGRIVRRYVGLEHEVAELKGDIEALAKPTS
jgi:protein SCO1/2